MVFDVKEGKVLFNVSNGLVNYSQKNNEYIWKKKAIIVNNVNTCNTTSICMGASYAAWHFPKEPYGKYKQEEDRLTALALEDPRVSEFYKKTMPVFWKAWQDGDKDALPPNQVHRVLEFATNTWFETKVVTFSESLDLNTIFTEIIEKNLPVVMSGNFPKESGSNSTIGHIVVLVGLIYDEKRVMRNNKFSIISALDTQPDALIFDDPWGNFIVGYEKNISGNDVICPYELAIKYLKPCNDTTRKWGYTFVKGAAIL
jgi:hypothetical protein